VSTERPLRFFNPIAGKPVPFSLSGLFLLDPETMLKLHGQSMRRMLSEVAGEAFYKKIERVSQGKQRAKPSLVLEFLDKVSVEFPLGDDFRAALKGDIQAQNRMDMLGPWEKHFLGAGEDLERMSGRGKLLLTIERASREPINRIKSEAIKEAVALMRSDPVISPFLWQDVVEAMEQCNTALQLLPAQAAVAIEVLLSYLAAADAELASADESTFLCLLPSRHVPGKNPTSRFFAYLRDAIGVKSLQALLDHPKANRLSLDIATLKRWSAGSHCPDPAWLRPVVKAFFGNASHSPVWNRYWGARYLNLTGYLAQTVMEKVQSPSLTSEQVLALRPWPAYPFSHTDCESWMQARYPYWFDYHLKQKRLPGRESREKRPMSLFS
jgi:hypothetical protein